MSNNKAIGRILLAAIFILSGAGQVADAAGIRRHDHGCWPACCHPARLSLGHFRSGCRSCRCRRLPDQDALYLLAASASSAACCSTWAALISMSIMINQIMFLKNFAIAAASWPCPLPVQAHLLTLAVAEIGPRPEMEPAGASRRVFHVRLKPGTPTTAADHARMGRCGNTEGQQVPATIEIGDTFCHLPDGHRLPEQILTAPVRLSSTRPAICSPASVVMIEIADLVAGGQCHAFAGSQLPMQGWEKPGRVLALAEQVKQPRPGEGGVTAGKALSSILKRPAWPPNRASPAPADHRRRYGYPAIDIRNRCRCR